MKKERLILALVAIAAGLIVASSIFYFYQNKRAPSVFPNQPSQITPSATNGRTAMLEITSPQDELITDSKTVEIVGKSQPKALIVINTNTNDYAVTAEDDGSFAQKIDLTDLENIISITAYTENGVSETKELTIIYSTEEF